MTPTILFAGEEKAGKRFCEIGMSILAHPTARHRLKMKDYRCILKKLLREQGRARDRIRFELPIVVRL